jgi:hypothetical protein
MKLDLAAGAGVDVEIQLSDVSRFAVGPFDAGVATSPVNMSKKGKFKEEAPRVQRRTSTTGRVSRSSDAKGSAG